MDDRPFEVQDGTEDAKNTLFEILHDKGEKKTGLKEFLSDLEDTEQNSGKWWLVTDEFNKPRGALTVRYINDLTYLRSIWTRVLRSEDQKIASKVLLDAWLEDAKNKVTKIQADLPLYHPLIRSVEEAGFIRDRMLMAAYDIDTDWAVSELPDGYVMRPFDLEDTEDVYKKLIEPELETSSPLFVSKEGFDDFVSKIPPSAMESWVLVEDNEENLVGFGASFLNHERTEDGERKAILIGPYSTESKVLIAIIKDMMAFWKAKGIEYLRILRVSELYPSVVNELELKLSNSTIRYIR